MTATWKRVNKNPQYHKSCLCRNLSASSPKWPRFFIQWSPREGTALLPPDSIWGLKFCPLFLPGLAGFGYKHRFLQQQVLPLGLKSPIPCRTQFWRCSAWRSQTSVGMEAWAGNLSFQGWLFRYSLIPWAQFYHHKCLHLKWNVATNPEVLIYLQAQTCTLNYKGNRYTFWTAWSLGKSPLGITPSQGPWNLAGKTEKEDNDWTKNMEAGRGNEGEKDIVQ